MKAFAAAIIGAVSAINVDDFEQKWFSNQVDHFDFQNADTYEQRYWVNDLYWDDAHTGPNFIYICGEYTCSVPEERLYPFMVGQDHNARLMVLEHRFYGSSQPFDDWSLDSFRWLSSEQALADLAYFIAEMNRDNQDRETVVIGGSYPGALSAWFRSRYPHMAVASWAASGVVNPIVDYWQYDEQIYASTKKSGDFCPRMIAENNLWLTGQAALRLNGMPNAIDPVLTEEESGMRTDDIMSFWGDMPAGAVQYGSRTTMCENLKTMEGMSQEDIWKTIVAQQREDGNPPLGYDTRPGSKITSTEIDVDYSGRAWTYQVCAEFGWFQTPSKEHPMRSVLVDVDYWLAYCERVFDGLNMKGKPQAWESGVDMGNQHGKGTNTFFTNGGEDPWQWATKLTADASLNQVARTSDCNDCAHCADLYTPKESDPVELQETRAMIADWLGEILGKKESSFLQ